MTTRTNLRPARASAGGVFLTGIGALLGRATLMSVYRFIRLPLFQGETLHKNTPILVEETS